jgi:hypothetical protein
MALFFMDHPERLLRLIAGIKKNSGDNPLVMLDSSAVLDFEREVELRQLKDRTFGPDKWYGPMQENFPVLIPEAVFGEISRHALTCFRAGHPEICRESIDWLKKCIKNIVLF